MRIAPTAALLACLLPIAAWAQQASPIGRWRSIDDATGKPKAVIEIQEAGNGTLTARIVQVLDTKDGPNPICTACEGKRRNQPIVGMHIAWGLKPQGKTWAAAASSTPRTARSTR